MATRTVRIDDLDERVSGEEVKEVSFALEGQEYTIDLGAKNQKRLHDALIEFIDAAKKVNGSTRSTKSTSVSRPGIIKWAKENGFPDAKGRPGPDIIAAYDAAHA